MHLCQVNKIEQYQTLNKLPGMDAVLVVKDIVVIYWKMIF